MPVVGFVSGQFNKEITHIFWEPGAQVTMFGLNAFAPPSGADYPDLIYVELPCNNTSIGDQCFRGCRKLFNDPTITQDMVTEFFSKITSIGSLAFSGLVNSMLSVPEDAGGLRDKKIYLSGNMTHIGNRAFNACYFGDLIQLGNVGHPFSFNALNPSTTNQACFWNAAQFTSVSTSSAPLNIVVYWGNDNNNEEDWKLRLEGRPGNETNQYTFIDA